MLLMASDFYFFRCNCSRAYALATSSNACKLATADLQHKEMTCDPAVPTGLMRRLFTDPEYKHQVRFVLAFLAMVVLFIVFNASTKWTGYHQAVINVVAALCQGNPIFWLVLLVMAGFIVYPLRDL